MSAEGEEGDGNFGIYGMGSRLHKIH